MSTSESTAAGSAAPLSSVSMKTAGIVAWLIAVVLTAIGSFSDVVADDSAESTGKDFVIWLVMMAVLAGVTYAIYRYWYSAAAAAPEAPNSALVGGAVALVTVLAFWTGLPAVFAVGAVLLGLRSSGWKPKVGIVLSVVALAVAVFAAFFG